MNFPFKMFVCISSLAFAGQAFALSDSPAGQTAPSQSGTSNSNPNFHLVLNAGITLGGDKIATVLTSEGTSQINGGSFVQFGGGGLYQFENKPIAVQVTVNYQTDDIAGTNGSAAFSRMPIEMLAYYTGKEKYRIGGGLRFVTAPKYSATINSFSDTVSYDSTTGIVGEVGYRVSPLAWMNFRFVSETYRAKSYTLSGVTDVTAAGKTSFSGSHFGVNFTLEFDAPKNTQASSSSASSNNP